MTVTTQELLGTAARRLRAAGSASASLDAQLLLGYATGRSRTDLLAHPERVVPGPEERQFEGLVARRESSEPIAYLLGEREFYGRVFRVDHRVLIPRPETELLVDLGRAAVARWRATNVEPTVVDVGTGCGAIAVSLAAEAHVNVIATDVSGEALALARGNAGGRTTSGSVMMVQTDLVAGLRGPLHVVLANLPYIPSGRALPREVKDYEPHVALFGGEQGTELLQRFLVETRPLLAPGAELCFELDEEEQAKPMAALSRGLYPGGGVSIRQDAGGYDRVVRIVT